MGEAATSKGQRRRNELIAAAALLLRQGGPSAVTMRAVANQAGCSVSATVYYFTDRDELVAEAARYNIAEWACAAEAVARHAQAARGVMTRSMAIDHLITAMLSRQTPLLGHYLQLISAGEEDTVSRIYFAGRGRLNNAISSILEVANLPYPAELVIAVIDGATVTALSEGRDSHETARTLLSQLFSKQTGVNTQPKSDTIEALPRPLM